MIETTETGTVTPAATKPPAPGTVATAAVSDRRRPGRRPDVSPELIPLLRSQEPQLVLEYDDQDQIAPARGLLVGVLLSAPIWAAIAYGGSWLLSR